VGKEWGVGVVGTGWGGRSGAAAPGSGAQGGGGVGQIGGKVNILNNIYFLPTTNIKLLRTIN
jgi:hypothetical protein